MGREKILSIRFSPGGLSFWTTEAAGGAQGASLRRDLWSVSAERELMFDPAKDRKESLREAARLVREAAGDTWRLAEVYPDTLQTVVVPGEYDSADAAAELLKINGIAPGEGNEVICAEVAPGIKAAMVCDRADMDVLREALGDVAIASPFGINNDSINKYGVGRRRAAAIYLTPAHAYITVYEKKSGAWLYADAMKWSAATDILYYMSVLDQQFGLRKGRVYLRGTGACEAGVLLRKYFKKTRCE